MIKVNDGHDPKAEDNSLLVEVDYASLPIPNNRLAKGFYYSFQNKWYSILDLLLPSLKKIIADNTTTPKWGSITGTLSQQTDLQTALDSKLTSTLTGNYIFVGDASNVAQGVEMSGDATIISDGTITLADTAVTAGTYGDATTVPQVTVDAKGRITNVTDVAITNTVIYASNNIVTATGSTSEVLVASIPLPIGLTTAMLRTAIYMFSSASVGTAINRLRIGTYETPISGSSGANAIANQILLASNQATNVNEGANLNRNIPIIGGASGFMRTQSSVNQSNEISQTTKLANTATIDFTQQQYLYISFQGQSTGVAGTYNGILIEILKA